MGETDHYRKIVLDLIVKEKKSIDNLLIIDIGCGYSPLTDSCDTFDLPIPYNGADSSKIKYHGDVREILSIVKVKYDVVYSSHLIEDFKEFEIKKLLKDWCKILKDDGIIILLLPDQQRYLNRCIIDNTLPNGSHKYDMFGLDFMCSIIKKIKILKIVYKKELFDRKNSHDSTYNIIFCLKKNNILISQNKDKDSNKTIY